MQTTFRRWRTSKGFGSEPINAAPSSKSPTLVAVHHGHIVTSCPTRKSLSLYKKSSLYYCCFIVLQKLFLCAPFGKQNGQQQKQNRPEMCKKATCSSCGTITLTCSSALNHGSNMNQQRARGGDAETTSQRSWTLCQEQNGVHVSRRSKCKERAILPKQKRQIPEVLQTIEGMEG